MSPTTTLAERVLGRNSTTSAAINKRTAPRDSPWRPQQEYFLRSRSNDYHYPFPLFLNLFSSASFASTPLSQQGVPYENQSTIPSPGYLHHTQRRRSRTTGPKSTPTLQDRAASHTPLSPPPPTKRTRAIVLHAALTRYKPGQMRRWIEEYNRGGVSVIKSREFGGWYERTGGPEN